MRLPWALAILCTIQSACGGDDTSAPSIPPDADPPDALPVDALPTDATVDGGPVFEHLIAHQDWQPTPVEEDPFADQIGERTRCEGIDELYVEQLGPDEVLSIDTSFCGYATVHQPLLVDVAAGDELRLRRFHFPVNIPEVTEGYVALALNGEIVWSTTIPLPTESGGETVVWQADSDWPHGTPVHYHVHNHGANEWVLIEILRAVE
ncbi:MAG: hypothetical protein ACE366_00540 [Bradymonadia bacterium]